MFKETALGLGSPYFKVSLWLFSSSRIEGEIVSITTNAGPIGSQHLRPPILLPSSPIDCSGSGQIGFLLSKIESTESRRISRVDWKTVIVIVCDESIEEVKFRERSLRSQAEWRFSPCIPSVLFIGNGKRSKITWENAPPGKKPRDNQQSLETYRWALRCTQCEPMPGPWHERHPVSRQNQALPLRCHTPS